LVCTTTVPSWTLCRSVHASREARRHRRARAPRRWRLRGRCVRSTCVLLRSGAARLARLQQVLGGPFLAPRVQRRLLAAPRVAALVERVLARLGAEEPGARRCQGFLRLAQRVLGAEQALPRGLGLLAQQLHVRRALRQCARPGHARGRRVEQARALLALRELERDDLALDAQAGVAAVLGRALPLQHHLPRGLGAMLAQAHQRVQRIALHGNIPFSAAADCSKPTSSCAGCCSSSRIAPMRAMAASASGSVPRLYSPSCSSSSMSWYLASSLRSWPAARRWASSTTRGMVRLRLTSTSMAG